MRPYLGRSLGYVLAKEKLAEVIVVGGNELEVLQRTHKPMKG